MVNKCWREQVEEGEQKSQEAKIGTVFLIDRGETHPLVSPAVGHMQRCSSFSLMCLHRCGLCDSSVLAGGLRGTGRWHIPDQMWWVWMRLGDVCVFSSSLPESHLISLGHLVMWCVVDVWFSAGCVEFGPDVSSSQRSVKVLLNSQDKVCSPPPRLQMAFAWS